MPIFSDRVMATFSWQDQPAPEHQDLEDPGELQRTVVGRSSEIFQFFFGRQSVEEVDDKPIVRPSRRPPTPPLTRPNAWTPTTPPPPIRVVKFQSPPPPPPAPKAVAQVVEIADESSEDSSKAWVSYFFFMRYRMHHGRTHLGIHIQRRFSLEADEICLF